jgi:signal transduction histidine kinase
MSGVSYGGSARNQPTGSPDGPDLGAASLWSHVSELPSRDSGVLLRLLGRLIEALARPTEHGRITRSLVDEIARMTQASAALLTPEPDDESILRLQTGSGDFADREGELLPAEASFAGAAFLGGEAVLTAELATDRRAFRGIEQQASLGSACAIPLVVDARRAGILLVARAANGPRFEAAELDLLSIAGDALAAALANTARFNQARDDRQRIEDWRRLRRLEGWCAAHDALDRAERRAVVRWDTRAGTFEWGAPLADLVGCTPDRFGATLAEWIEHVADKERDPVRQTLERGRYGWDEISISFGVSLAGGTYRRVQMRLLSPQPESSVRLGILCDAGGALRRPPIENGRSADSEAVAQLVRALRHEINNPLAAVIGQLQLLERESDVADNPPLHEALHIVHEESRRIESLVRRLAAIERDPWGPFVNRQGGLDLPPEP